MSAQANTAGKDAGKPIAFVSAQALRERMHDAVNDPTCAPASAAPWTSCMAKRAAQFPDADELDSLRSLSESIRQYSLSKLPDLLEQLEANLTRNGVQVHWAETPEEANAIMLGIAQRHAGQADRSRASRWSARRSSSTTPWKPPA
jgi:L-lactate dehydrogenase complex protein LldF